MKPALKEYHINSTILLIFIFGIKEILYSFTGDKSGYEYSPFGLHIEHVISFVLGICFISVTRSLFKRLRNAWLLAVLIVIPIIIVNLFEKLYMNLSTILAIYLLISLLVQHSSFKKESNPMSVRKSIIICILLVLCNVIFETANFYIYRESFDNVNDMGDSFLSTLKLIFFVDTMSTNKNIQNAVKLTEALLILNLMGVFQIVTLLLMPFILKPKDTCTDMQKVQDLLAKHGENPISSLILEKGKEYFFSECVVGVIGYTVVKNVAIVAGDPICVKEDLSLFLNKFREYCSSHSLSICFCQISKDHRQIFETQGFSFQEYGKEAIINLKEYSISGSKTAKVRWANNKMDKMGISVFEYKPHHKRDEEIEEQLANVSSEWLKMKNGSEFAFTMGTLSFDHPYNRRYFVAKDQENSILGFIVCLPYKQNTGYFIDMTRRRQVAPLGIMEKLVIGTCEMLKKEGVAEVSLGLAPLADISYDKTIQSRVLHGTFKLIYKSMNSIYGFKTLYDYKKKYNPSYWEPRYIAFSTKLFTPVIGYAMLKAKNPGGIRELLFSKVKGRLCIGSCTIGCKVYDERS